MPGDFTVPRRNEDGTACGCPFIDDLAAFAHRFNRQTGWLVAACHANPPRPGGPAVRGPGEQALVRQRQAQGVPLAERVGQALQPLVAAAGLDWSAAWLRAAAAGA